MTQWAKALVTNLMTYLSLALRTHVAGRIDLHKLPLISACMPQSVPTSPQNLNKRRPHCP